MKNIKVHYKIFIFDLSKMVKTITNTLISFLGRTNARTFHENPNLIHTEHTFINPKSA